MSAKDLEILRIIERNGVAHSLYWCRWPKMRAVEHPYAVMTQSDLPCPFFNNVFSAEIAEADVASVVADLTSQFQMRNVPCFWWSGPVHHDQRVVSILEQRRFVKAFDAAAMALSLTNCPTRESADVLITEISSAAQLADWSRTCSSAFEFDDNLSGWWQDLFASIPYGGSSPLRHYLASINGEPAGTASAYIEDGVVCLASVGVRTEFRRQGIGSALTVAALKFARMVGCRLGVLFSSPMAIPMYKALGFRQYGTGHCYVWSPEVDRE